VAFLFIVFILGIWIYIKQKKTKNVEQVEQYISPIQNNQNKEYQYSSNKWISVNSNNQILINENKQVPINNDYELIQRLRELQNKYFEDFVAKIFEFNGYVIDRPPQYVLIN